MSRVLRRPASEFRSVDDYEAVTAPVYVWRDAVARDAPTGARSTGSHACARGALRSAAAARRRRARDGAVLAARRAPASRARALVAGFPLAVAALNRAGLARCAPRSPAASCAAPACGRWARWPERLGFGDAYVVFGHTHRAGPLPGDDQQEWRGRGAADGADATPAESGARLVNSGSWTYDAVFLQRHAGREPLLARHVRRSSRTTARRSCGACSPTAARAACRRAHGGADGGVARHTSRVADRAAQAQPAGEARRAGSSRRRRLQLELARGVALVLDQHVRAGVGRPRSPRRCRRRAPPACRAPSSTAHTPPAS